MTFKSVNEYMQGRDVFITGATGKQIEGKQQVDTSFDLIPSQKVSLGRLFWRNYSAPVIASVVYSFWFARKRINPLKNAYVSFSAVLFLTK